MSDSTQGGHAARTRILLDAPVLPTLFRLAAPNVLGLLVVTVMIGFDGWILGRLGPDALAGAALVLPLSMLMTQMSAGGMGGAVTAAVARALGAGRPRDAESLAWHALMIAVALATVFTLVLLAAGQRLYAAMGGQGGALEAALAYSDVLFAGALLTWLANTFAAIVRGAGNMALPSGTMVAMAFVHLGLCPLLVFGSGGWAGLGIAGAAVSNLATSTLTIAVLAAWLVRGGGFRRSGIGSRPRRTDFAAILRVGAPASLSPVLSNLSVALVTALVGGYGTAALAGYGIAARLEYVMVPVAFGFGTALTALVATNMGAGQRERALRATWSGASVVAGFTGLVGIAAAIQPSWWMNMFSGDPEVLDFGARYLRVVGASYLMFGLGLALFFASQGAGRMFWPLAGSFARVLCVGGVGWLAARVFDAGAEVLFAVVAAGFLLYALIIAASIRLGSWARG